MPIAPKDARWKTAEIKSKEVLHINEDLNITATHMKRIDTDLAKEVKRLEAEHRDVSVPSGVRKLQKAMDLAHDAYEKVEEASRALNDAAQEFET
jgi:hypothetical protein